MKCWVVSVVVHFHVDCQYRLVNKKFTKTSAFYVFSIAFMLRLHLYNNTFLCISKRLVITVKAIWEKNGWLHLFNCLSKHLPIGTGKKNRLKDWIRTQSYCSRDHRWQEKSFNLSAGHGIFHFWELLCSLLVTDNLILTLENIRWSQQFPDGTTWVPVQKLFRECLNCEPEQQTLPEFMRSCGIFSSQTYLHIYIL